jgi:hypothetical protein
MFIKEVQFGKGECEWILDGSCFLVKQVKIVGVVFVILALG